MVFVVLPCDIHPGFVQQIIQDVSLALLTAVPLCGRLLVRSFYHSMVTIASYVWNWLFCFQGVWLCTSQSFYKFAIHIVECDTWETSLVHCRILLLMLRTRNNTQQWTRDICDYGNNYIIIIIIIVWAIWLVHGCAIFSPIACIGGYCMVRVIMETSDCKRTVQYLGMLGLTCETSCRTLHGSVYSQGTLWAQNFSRRGWAIWWTSYRSPLVHAMLCL